MVVCKLGNSCVDQNEAVKLFCYGCNGGFHPYCLRISRKASIHVEELSDILKFVCETCSGQTSLDITRSLIRLNDRIDKQISVSGGVVESINKLKSATDTNTSITDDLSGSNEDIVRQLSSLMSEVESIQKITYSTLSSVNACKDELKSDLGPKLELLKDYLTERLVVLQHHIDDRIVSSTEGIKQMFEHTATSLEKLIESSIEHGMMNINNTVASALATSSSFNSNTVSSLEATIVRLQDEVDAAVCLLASHSSPTRGSELHLYDDERSDVSLLQELLHVPSQDTEFVDIELEPRLLLNPVAMMKDKFDWFATKNLATLFVNFNCDLQSLNAHGSESRKVVEHKNKRHRPKKPACNQPLQKKAKHQLRPNARKNRHQHESRPGYWVLSPEFRAKLCGKKTKRKTNRRNYRIVSRNKTKSHPGLHKRPSSNAVSNDKSNTSNSTISHKWLYISGFNGSITPLQVANYMQYKLNCNELSCFPLVPKGLTLTSRRKVAYKVRVPASTAVTAAQDVVWPSHLNVRLFLENKDFISLRQGQRRPMNH